MDAVQWNEHLLSKFWCRLAWLAFQVSNKMNTTKVVFGGVTNMLNHNVVMWLQRANTP